MSMEFGLGFWYLYFGVGCLDVVPFKDGSTLRWVALSNYVLFFNLFLY